MPSSTASVSALTRRPAAPASLWLSITTALRAGATDVTVGTRSTLPPWRRSRTSRRRPKAEPARREQALVIGLGVAPVVEEALVEILRAESSRRGRSGPSARTGPCEATAIAHHRIDFARAGGLPGRCAGLRSWQRPGSRGSPASPTITVRGSALCRRHHGVDHPLRGRRRITSTSFTAAPIAICMPQTRSRCFRERAIEAMHRRGIGGHDAGRDHRFESAEQLRFTRGSEHCPTTMGALRSSILSATIYRPWRHRRR